MTTERVTIPCTTLPRLIGPGAPCIDPEGDLAQPFQPDLVDPDRWICAWSVMPLTVPQELQATTWSVEELHLVLFEPADSFRTMLGLSIAQRALQTASPKAFEAWLGRCAREVWMTKATSVGFDDAAGWFRCAQFIAESLKAVGRGA